MPALQRSATPHRQTHTSREPWNKNHAIICQLFLLANPKKMLLSGGFGFQNGTVFGVLNWGLLGLKKGLFLGPKKWAPMNAALLKGLGKPGARISKPGPKKWSPKTGPKIGPIIFAPQQQAVSKKSTRRNIYTKLLCARMALNSRLHKGFQIKT